MEKLTFDKLPQSVQLLLNKTTQLESLIKEILSQRDQNQDDLLTIKEAATLLHLKPSTVRSKIAARTIPSYKEGKRRYLLRSELIHWIKEGKQKTITEINKNATLYIKRGGK